MDRTAKYILISAFSAIIITGGIFVWQYFGTQKETPPPQPEQTQIDETADWKIYNNNKYNFQLNYPDYFRHIASSSHDFFDIHNSSVTAPNGVYLGEELLVSVITQPISEIKF